MRPTTTQLAGSARLDAPPVEMTGSLITTGDSEAGTLSDMPTETTIERRVRFGRELERLRLADPRGLSQGAAGKLADPAISQRMWSKMERGESSIEAMVPAFQVLGYTFTFDVVKTTAG